MAKEAGGAGAAGGEEMLVELEADVASWLREACLALLDAAGGLLGGAVVGVGPDFELR